MVRRLSFDEWSLALRELKCIRLRARMTHSYLLEQCFTRAIYSLNVTRIPMLAALELKNTSECIRHLSLRRSVTDLSERLAPYTAVEFAEPGVVQFPDCTSPPELTRHA